jgi:hypothetical protein
VLRATQDDAQFVLRNLSGDRQELVYVKDVAAYPVNQLYQRRSRRLATGESLAFVNVFAARSGGAPSLEAVLCGPERLAVSDGAGQTVMGVGDLAASSVRADAAAWMVDSDAIRLASAGRCVRDGSTVWQSGEPADVRIAGSQAAVAVAATTPDPGQHPVSSTVGVEAIALASAVRIDPASLAAPVAPLGHPASAVLADAVVQPLQWRYSKFPRTPQPIRVESVVTRPDPHPGYRPKERLVDGHVSSSKGSCLFPKGEHAEIDLDLGQVYGISDVRIRAWEMFEHWHTTNRAVFTSLDGETWEPAPTEPAVVGTQRWGSNVNTIYGVKLDRQARFVRFAADPVNEEAGVYLAEIEVIGQEEGALPELTAVLAEDIDGDGETEMVTGTGAGHIVALNSSGEEIWRVDIGAPITVLAAIPVGGSGARRVIYGASQNLLGTIDADGTKVKEIGVPQYRGIASEPQNITVADLDGDGVPSIVVGARSWQYLAYTPDLELEWKNVIYAHSATVAEVADLDGDGNMETVGGNAYYCMNIINSDGSRRLRAGRFGPEQSAVTSADLTGNGKREVVLGTDGGDVLVFDLEGNQLWERNVGDRVTSLCPVSVGGTDAVLAASESGFVWALDGAGKALWSVNLGEPVRRMIAIPGGVACAVSGAGIVTLTESGRVATVSATPAAAMDISVRNGFCGAMLRDGTLCAAPVAIRE